MKVFVVHCTQPGYAREDASTSDVIGVYTNKEVTRKVTLLGHGSYDEVKVDYIFPGIKATGTEFGMTL